MKSTALAVLAEYQQRNPGEIAHMRQLAADLHNNPGNLTDRRNLQGHLTASCLVLNDSETAVLLIDHLVLKRWLQPGGHVDAGESLWEAAKRETAEETHIGDIVSLLNDGDTPLVLDIDTHTIKANPKKDEGEHTHHDFMFAAKAKAGAVLGHQPLEVSAAKWLSLSETRLLPNKRLVRALNKLELALDAQFAAKLEKAQALVGHTVVITGQPYSRLAEKRDVGVCSAVVQIPGVRQVDVVLANGCRFGLNLDVVEADQLSGVATALSPFLRQVKLYAPAPAVMA